MWTVDALALLINKVREKVDSLIVPTKVSDLVNDSGYVDSDTYSSVAAVIAKANALGQGVSFFGDIPQTFATTLTGRSANAQAWFMKATTARVDYMCWQGATAAQYKISWGNIVIADGTVNRKTVVEESEAYYAAGDTFTATGYVPLAGYVTDSAKMLRVAVPVAKSLANITNIDVTAFTGGVRTTDAGYLDGRNTTYNWINSTYTITATKASDNLVMVELTKASAFSNVTTNTPVTFAAYPITLSFS